MVLASFRLDIHRVRVCVLRRNIERIRSIYVTSCVPMLLSLQNVSLKHILFKYKEFQFGDVVVRFS